MALHTRATIHGTPRHHVLKVVALDDFLRLNHDPSYCALWVNDSAQLSRSRALQDVEWGALIGEGACDHYDAVTPCRVGQLRDATVVSPGDVISVHPHKGLITSLYRRGSKNNSLLVTERCNSYCVMCSQPPIERDETGRVEELFSLIRLIDSDEATLGITGGEPTLLGPELFRLLAEIRTRLPRTALHILTNGRRFEDRFFTADASRAAPTDAVWAIPLYTESPEIHDFVVQSAGAFRQTLRGLWNLAGVGGRVELRVVLQRAVVPRIRQLAHFVARNLSFVDHVAWMGLEPMGFAKPNWKAIWIEPEEFVAPLADAIATLDHFKISTSIFNVPLCVLPPELRPYAAQSISDWKNTFLPECSSCVARRRCAGFFASVGREHVPKAVSPLTELAGLPSQS